MKRWAPSALSLLGAVFGFVAAILYPCPAFSGLALLSLALDALDGPLARLLDEESVFGASLDWSIDCALAHVFVWRAFEPTTAVLLSLALVLAQSFSKSDGPIVLGSTTIRHVSGRAPLTFVLVLRALAS